MQIETVAVLGAGTMGSGIAALCAQAGCRVTLLDLSRAAAEQAIGRMVEGRSPMLDDSSRVELITPGSFDDTAIFDALAFAFSGLLLWHFIRLELSSWRFGERAPTYLETPLWLPRLAMAIGVAALCFSIARTFLAHVRRFRALSRS